MTLRERYNLLRQRFGHQADPDTWWPIYYGLTTPPTFERAITALLVRNSRWPIVEQAVARLHQYDLLTAAALAHAPEELIAECIRPTGLSRQKARFLKGLGGWIHSQFASEQAFCTEVRHGDLRIAQGIGDETADRILLFACSRLAWPVDAACYRVLAHYGVIPAVPRTESQKKRLTAAIKQLVDEQMPHRLDSWQRLHALMHLEDERLRQAR